MALDWQRLATAMLKRFVRRSERLAAMIGEGCELEGRCRFVGLAIVEGRFTGDVLTAEELVVGDRGVIAATVQARTLLVRGSISGNIVATERVELAPTARVVGDIETPSLAVADGAVLDGRCRMTGLRAEAQAEGVVVPLVR